MIVADNIIEFVVPKVLLLCMPRILPLFVVQAHSTHKSGLPLPVSAVGLISRHFQNTHRILGPIFPVIAYILEMLSISTLNCMFIGG